MRRNAPRFAAPPIHPAPETDPHLYGQIFTALLPGGDAGTEATVQVMRAIVHDSDRHGYVDALIDEKLPGLRSASFDEATRMIYDYLRQVQQFTRDPKGAEMPRIVDQLCWELLQYGKVECDCDDLAMLGVALHRKLGHRTAFVVVGRRLPGPFQHVFFAVAPPGGAEKWTPMNVWDQRWRWRMPSARWLPTDPQERTPLGVWPASRRRKIIPVDQVQR